MLAFGIRYLSGYVAASTAPDDLAAEWPPHPGRVFMALAAAHFKTGADPRESEALLWLERLEKDGEPTAPCIIAPDALQRTVVAHYVPVNDKPGPSKALLQSVPVTRDRQPRTFSRAWLAEDTAFLLWPDAEADEAIRDVRSGRRLRQLRSANPGPSMGERSKIVIAIAPNSAANTFVNAFGRAVAEGGFGVVGYRQRCWNLAGHPDLLTRVSAVESR